MEQKTKNRIRLRDIAPVRLAISVLAGLAVAVSAALRAGDGKAMEKVYYGFSRPYHRFMARLCSHLGFSAAELLYALALGFVAVYITLQIIKKIRRPHKWKTVYITIITMVMLSLTVWAAYCYLWTPYYYAPTFAAQSGTDDGAVSTAELTAVTEYFAQKANEYADRVQRDKDGLYSVSRDDILDRAAGVYENASGKWTFLEGDALRPKGIICSNVMSLTDFTGFFFPLTGETNVNMDSPAVMLPFTAEHEISHQRGIGEEQECNFIAAAACMASGDPDYEYSGALTSYIYLSNALYGADRAAWTRIHAVLSASVLRDLAQDKTYWEKYEDTLVNRLSSSAYESFLQGNGQTLGLESYGACVNLLVHYFGAG